MKKQVMITLLAVLTFSILPGCGKSKNDGPVIGGGGAVGVYPPVGTVGSSFAATGMIEVSNATGAVRGILQGTSAAAGGGILYTRTNHFGDVVDLYLPGSTQPGVGFTQMQATVIVRLSQATIDAFTYYCGQGPVRAEFGTDENGFIAYTVPLTSGSPGKITMSIKLRTASNCFGYI